MEFEKLRFEVSDGVARLGLNRPEVGNAIDMQLARELLRAALACDSNPEIRAVRLGAEGRAFCVGGDLKAFAAYGDALSASLKELTVYLHAALARLARLKAPVVVAVGGVAAGAGMSLALSGDLVLAAESASFTTAYTAVGLAPDGGTTHLLPRLIGLRRSQELLLTNRRLSAKEALAWGMVNRVVPDAALVGEADELAGQLAAGPTRAYASVKALLATCFEQPLAAQLEAEARAISEAGASADAREGITAFVEKRAPRFRGC